MAQIQGGDELITKSKLQFELHRFYTTIRKYLNGTGTGAGIVTYYNDLQERPVEADALDMDSICDPLPEDYIKTGNVGITITTTSNKGSNIGYQMNTNVTVEKVEG